MRTFLAALAAVSLVGVVAPAAQTGEADAAWRAPVEIRIAGRIGVGSPEADALRAELDAYAASPWRNVTITYEEYDDLAATLAEPDPPDLVLVAQPGILREHADQLVDMRRYVWQWRLRHDYGDYMIDQVTVDGSIAGIPVKAARKSLVWYRPDAFAARGYTVPETFTELVALSDQMVANAETPWCNYMESGEVTGWMGTDWIEDLLLTAEGGDVYDQWVTHDVLFADQRVEAAFERFDFIMDTPGYVFDRADILNRNFFDNALPLGEDDCLMHKQASFFAAFIGAAGLDLDDFAAFDFPAVDPAYADAITGGTDYVAAVTNSWQVRRLVRFMASPRFGASAIADSGTGWLLPNVRFRLDRYGDEMTRSLAESLRAALTADLFRFDASDQMPPEVGFDSFFEGVRDLLDGVRTIPQVLADNDAAWPSS